MMRTHDADLEARLVREHTSEWNRRFTVRLRDESEVEAVLYRANTLCVSSQVGCAVGCPFCASGFGGFARQLELGEMIATVEAVERLGVQLTGVTVSGMGEPLHNASAVSAFVRWCHTRRTFASVTTSGGPLHRLADWLADLPHHGLTISVHAGSEDVRAKLVPRGPALAPLFAVLQSALGRSSRRRLKKTALAYLMIRGVNDHPDELQAFADRVLALHEGDRRPRVHLYAYNSVSTSDASAVGREAYEQAYKSLVDRGLAVSMSSQARQDANGGCGTLVGLRPKRAESTPASTA